MESTYFPSSKITLSCRRGRWNNYSPADQQQKWVWISHLTEPWVPVWVPGDEKRITGFNTHLLHLPVCDWCWSSNTLVTWWAEPTLRKRHWCWERSRAGGEADDRGWDGWMASPTQWTWTWVNSGRWWRTGRPGMLRFMGLQRVEHDWTEQKTCWKDTLKWSCSVMSDSLQPHGL